MFKEIYNAAGGAITYALVGLGIQEPPKEQLSMVNTLLSDRGTCASLGLEAERSTIRAQWNEARQRVDVKSTTHHDRVAGAYVMPKLVGDGCMRRDTIDSAEVFFQPFDLQQKFLLKEYGEQRIADVAQEARSLSHIHGMKPKF